MTNPTDKPCTCNSPTYRWDRDRCSHCSGEILPEPLVTHLYILEGGDVLVTSNRDPVGRVISLHALPQGYSLQNTIQLLKHNLSYLEYEQKRLEILGLTHR